MSTPVPVEPGYQCPLCPDHRDDIFFWSDILRKPICQGCDYELWDLIVCEHTRQESRLLDRLEQLVRMEFDEYRLLELEALSACLEEQGTSPSQELAVFLADIPLLKARLRQKK